MRRLISTVMLMASTTFVVITGPVGVAADSARDRIPLPRGFFPEGISIRPNGTFYVGSIPTGAIFSGDVRTGEGSVLVEAVEGRSAIGLKVHRGRLFVAGGATGQAYVYDADSGAEVATFQLAEQGSFVNDVVVTRRAAWFTDSFNPVLYRVPLSRSGAPRDDVETVPLTGDIRFREGFNVNGIEARADPTKLIIVQSNTGRLFMVDARTGNTRRIDLEGERVRNGDGLLLDAGCLFVVQNQNRIAVVELEDGREGEVERRVSDEDLDVPTTVDDFENRLYVVNARFGTTPTPETRYWIAVLPKPPCDDDNGRIDIDVVARGLNNPRGLDLSPDGDLYVAESGRGGNGPCIRTSAGVDECLGRTGAITVVEDADEAQTRLVRGLPSIANPEGGFARAIGPSDIDFRGDRALVTVGLAADPALRADLGRAGRRMGRVLVLNEDGTLRNLADIAAFEAANDPDAGRPGAAVDTNPNSVLAVRRGGIVADAGGNDLLRIRRSGRVSTVAVFRFLMVDAPDFLGLPPGTQIPMQPVPTSVTRGPDGAFYVGQLTGFPFPEGQAKVFRVVPGERPTVFARGFTHITDLEFDDRGNLYVLQLGTNSLLGDPGPGALIRVGRNGERSQIARGRLTFPMGLAVEDGDEFYVSDRGDSPGRGRVLEIETDG